MQTHVRAITARAGGTTGAVYKNKDSIFDALTGTAFDEFLTVLTHSAIHESEEVNMKTFDLSTICAAALSKRLPFQGL